jgi:glyoxylase-like metal-dependent hydrolase (beta-lactamase superfamily II)
LSWEIGEVTVTKIVESEAELPLQGLIPMATAEILGSHSDWLKPHFIDDAGNCVLSIHALLIESGGLKIVVDTCVGEHKIPGMESMSVKNNPFLENISSAGFDRESVDIVLCTHLHFDHVGWNTMTQDEKIVPTFPNARYLFAKQEWQHWNSQAPGPYTTTYINTVKVVHEAGLVDLVEMNHRINSEVYLQPSTGHTPGHVSVCIESNGETAFITGDMTHHPVQWAETSWGIDADSNSETATATRIAIGKQYADTDVLIIGTHYPSPTSGHVVTRGEGHIFKASDS